MRAQFSIWASVTALAAFAALHAGGCAAQVADSGNPDAGDDAGPVTSGPPTAYDSGPAANPYGDGGSAPAGDAGGGKSDGGPAPPMGCSAPSDCPGNGDHANVSCTSQKCGLTCQGEFYDVNDDPTDGCEIEDAPLDAHTRAKATDQGTYGCSDGSSTQDVDGHIPSDSRVHESPSVDGFVPEVGAAPDWFKIHGSGAGICQNDANFDVSVNGALAPTCYRLTLITDKMGTQKCDTNASGKCSIGNGAGSYSDNSDIYVVVERANNAGCTPIVSDDAKYHLHGHL